MNVVIEESPSCTEINKNFIQYSEVDSLSGTGSSSTTGSTTDEDDDYFLRFSSMAGWQSLVLMPFQPQMYSVILGCIVVWYSLAIFSVAFAFGSPRDEVRLEQSVISSLAYTGDVGYFFDWVCMVVFKNADWSETNIQYKPRHGFILFVEMLSLIPLEPIYAILVRPDMRIYYCLKLRYCLRLTRLYVFYKEISGYVGHYTYLVDMIVYFVMLLFLVITMSAIYYVKICEEACSYGDQEMLVMAIYLCLVSIIPTGIKNVISKYNTKFDDGLLISLLSFFITFVFSAGFICDILRKLRPRFVTMNSFGRYKAKLNEWRGQIEWSTFHKKYEKLVDEYAVIYWNKTKGRSFSANLVSKLPQIIYKDLTLDVSWIALKHSHLFGNEDMYFLRAVAETMEHKFLCPGEVIFKKRRNKCSFVYIVSGELEVLSEEDGETPILTFSAGTCLGESTLAVSYPSVNTVVSKGITDIVTLDHKHIVRLAKKYPLQVKTLVGNINYRYRRARAFRIIREYQFSYQSTNERIGVLALKWLKLTLRKLLYGDTEEGGMYITETLDQMEEYVFCTQYLDLLVQSEDTGSANDSTFHRSTFPIIFRSDSLLLTIWNIYVLIHVLWYSFMFPYVYAYLPSVHFAYYVLQIYITMVWMVDIYIKTSTAVQTKYITCTEIGDIFVYNLTQLYYLIDIIAAIPSEIIVYYLEGYLDEEKMILYAANRLLKIYRLETFFDSIRVSINRVVVINCCKYALYFFFLCYYNSLVLYLLGRLDENKKYFDEYLVTFEATTPIGWICYTFALAIAFIRDSSLTTFPFTSSYNTMIYLTILMVFNLLFCFFFTAHSASMATMQVIDNYCMIEFVRNVANVMDSYEFDNNLKLRIWSYIDLQYAISGTLFLFERKLFKKLPRDLYSITNVLYPGTFLKGLVPFYHLDDKIISSLAMASVVGLVLSNETFKSFGESCTEIHMLMHGFCTVKQMEGEENVVGPGEVFCFMEAAFDKRSMVHITTITSCRIVTIKYTAFTNILFNYPDQYRCFEETVKYFPYWEEIERLSEMDTDSLRPKCFHTPEVVKNVKYFGYKIKKRTIQYYAYHGGFPRWASFVKYLLLRFTFYSNGSFVYYWELSRCVAIVLNIAILPTTLHLSKNQSYWLFFGTIFDCMSVLDVYLRHHYSYFDNRNLEITHPFKTAANYWKHSFALDALSCMPLEYLLTYLIGDYPTLWRANRILQLYRVFGFLKILSGKIKVEGFWRIVLYIPLVLLLINYTNIAVLRLVCTTENATYVCAKGSWLESLQNNPVFAVYLCNMIFVSSIITGENFYIAKVYTVIDIRIFVFLSFVGLFMDVFVTSKIIAWNLSINKDLINYQQAVNHLINYLSLSKIDKKLKRELIKHYDYTWDKTKGKTIAEVFSVFKTYFMTDMLCQVYGKVLTRSSIFPQPNEHFFRGFLLEVQQEIYLNTGIIYRVNDISGDVFVLLKGKVAVVGADQNRLATLRVGSIFGNLDEVPLGRRTISIVATGHVEVLKFSSVTLYAHLTKFPRMLKHFKKLTSFHVDYIAEEETFFAEDNNKFFRVPSEVLKLRYQEQLEDINFFKVLKRNMWLHYWEQIVLNVVYFLNYVVEMYHLSCLESHFLCYFLLYLFDLIYIVKIYLKFHTSYEDEYGRVIMIRGMIAKRYRAQKMGFYFDLCTVIPLEFICFTFYDSSIFHLVFAVCRLNRLPRIIQTVLYCRNLTQKLNVRVTFVSFLYLFLCTFLIQINLGVVLRMTDGEHSDSLHGRIQLFIVCVERVIDACRKVGSAIPLVNTNILKLLSIILILISAEFIHIMFMAESSVIILVITHSKSLYEQFNLFLKSYMQSENVSEPLMDRVNNYMTLLWTHHSGVQFPKLLEKAPYYLKEGVLYSMFGVHLMKHSVLMHCHKDLTRQICAHMKTFIFFPGDNVVYVGDVDNCMYFIHEGEVQALSEDTMYSEVVEETLADGDMFGLDQGMYAKCGHEFTYKCIKYSILIALKREDWIYLLDFFPASKRMIYDKSKEM